MAPPRPTTATHAIIPLARNTVLLPGIVLRIPIAGNRTDIPALLSNIYSRTASKTPRDRSDNANVVCVPLSSPYLTPSGQKVTSQDGRNSKIGERPEVDPSNATKDDLFRCGVAAKITGVEGRGTGEFALLVEGLTRVRIEEVIKERPYFEAEVTYHYDDGENLSHI